MTTCDPGASDVFTQGLTCSPRFTALRASMPAATMTYGFDVLVQDVMAAITTSPWPRSKFVPGTGTRFPASWPLPYSLSSASAKALAARASGTRSCGRFGPAIDGSTSARLSAMVSVNTGSGVSPSRNRPCAWA